MDEQTAETASWRAPLGACTVVVAGLGSLPILMMDEFEAIGESAFGIDGGSDNLFIMLGAFVLLWTLGATLLATLSPRPLLEGFLAGVLQVAAVTAWLLAAPGFLLGDLLVIGPVYAALFIGFGSLAGLAAQRARTRDLRQRRVAIAAVASGVVLMLTVSTMLSSGDGSDPLLWVVAWTLSAAFVVAGIVALRRPNPSEA